MNAFTNDASLRDSTEDQIVVAANALAVEGYYVFEHFISSNEVSSLISALQKLEEEGKLKKAGIGNKDEFQVNHEIRGDYIKWLYRDSPFQAVRNYLEQMDLLKLRLKELLFLPLMDFECHLAVYPGGAGYHRHKDAFQHRNHRLFSLVTYLNVDWKTEDGGALMLYPENDQPFKVEPLAGRAIIFRSEIEHEVLPATRERMSVTGWFLNQPANLKI
ncbi:MAG TPA: hypothetical protein DDY13_06130 [Cytophagales bacterium]|jgi:SM-20-related protein|nr:hypothetical protein [Cytophagales bacterium]